MATRCTCRPGRDYDGSEFGPCEYCESFADEEDARAAEVHRLQEALTEATAELIYLRKYGRDGAIWSANDSKDVWREMARKELQ